VKFTCTPIEPIVEAPEALATVHWNGGSFTIPAEEEGNCMNRGSETFPNDQIRRITDMMAGCTVNFYQHGCPGGRVGTITHVTAPRNSLFSLGISALTVNCGSDEEPEPEPVCCQAIEASCLACQEGVSEEEFCSDSSNAQVSGCGDVLATLHWDGGSFAFAAGQEDVCVSAGSGTFPNDRLEFVSGLRQGCEVDLYQHGCPGGRVGTITRLTEDQAGLRNLGVSAVKFTCTPIEPIVEAPDALATVHWNGGSFTIPAEEEGNCMNRGSETFPNDQIRRISDMMAGCTVNFYQHGCPGGRVGTITHVTAPRNGLFSLGISALTVNCGNDEEPEPEPVCCQAIEASCLACQEGVSEEEFCSDSSNAQVSGCGDVLATLHWDGGSFAFAAGQEDVCVSAGSGTFPNDRLEFVSGLRQGCEVDLYQHGCPGGRVGTITRLTEDQAGLRNLGVSAVKFTCTPIEPIVEAPEALATVHWNGGSFTIPAEEEGNCMVRGSETFPNDQIRRITDMMAGCTVDFYQHGCPGGRVGTTTHVTAPRNGLFSLGVTALTVNC